MPNSPLCRAAIDTGGDWIALTWGDGHGARFHAVWLRDNALDPASRDPGSGQRLLSVLDIPGQTRLSHASIDAAGALCVSFAPDGKRAVFDGDWLRRHCYDKPDTVALGWMADHIRCWDGSLSDALPSASLPHLQADHGALCEWLEAIRHYGFAMLRDMPIADGALMEVVALFGYVRETNYGRWFEVRSQVNPINLAYTGLALQAHTDNPYRDPVPTLQLLACLDDTAEGGDSIVVDGFHAARQLRRESSINFELLSRYCARFEFRGASGVCLRARKPMIELTPDGELVAVRFNNRSAAPFTDIPFDQMRAYYHAYRHFAEIINRAAMEVTFKLSPGELFIVDNTRVLHARKGFASAGSRWLQGCYADKDSLYSTLANLREARAQ